ncbi:heme-dependent oxidative N-demethylase family protein [Mesorhizobium sp.]|uniref:heme-dependent oxidative N-demethylase family protein n=1 Tax=Mesorhizobium sp. TaxID=1871066 RepID=UPI003BA89817
MNQHKTVPTHTPYDGSSRLFSIGLKPLDPAGWIEVDDHLLPYLAEKRRLYADIPERVFVEEDGTRDAQREVLDLLVEHLPAHFPQTHRRSGEGVELVGAAGKQDSGFGAGGFKDAPLIAASLLVQEDLILMRRDDSGWRLVAGSLCFPSSWSLIEKFGRPLQEIHAPVPGFGPGTRPAELINRMFDGLQGQAVERYNWSIQSDNALYHPLSDIQRIDRATNRPSRFPDGDINAHAFIRVERQTLRKLPASRDILFTIRIHLDPLRVLAGHPDRAALATSFAAQLEALDLAQLDYKGMTSDRDRLVAVLNNMASDA